MTDIQSPLPGTFYHRPDPDQPPFKAKGDSVAEGDVIGLIEVMKTFIEVKAEAVDSDDEDVVVSSLASVPAAAATLAAMQQGA